MELTALEFRLGVPRPIAMRHMAERTDVHEIGSLVGLLLQSERFGASIADAFRTFARSMREDRSFVAEEQAEKTSVKMIFPMVGFIFPALLIVLAGPTVLGLAVYVAVLLAWAVVLIVYAIRRRVIGDAHLSEHGIEAEKTADTWMHEHISGAEVEVDAAVGEGPLDPELIRRAREEGYANEAP